MSAVPSPILQDVEDSVGQGSPKLATKAAAYFVVVALATAVSVLPLLSRLSPHTPGWPTFVILGLIAAVAQLFVVRTPRNQSYHTTIVFLIPAAMLLPPELVAFMGLIQHIPEWLKNRSAWYIQIFNICNWTLSILAAYAAFHAVLGLNPGSDVQYAIAGIAAAASMVFVNHVLMAPMLHLARGHSIRESGLFSFPSLSTDLVLAMLGVAMAFFWIINPWLIPFAVAPLLLIHRSLSVPQLQEEARVDPKTGLFNARHFAVALNEELVRAERFDRPLSLVMADLDLLRDINNTYGHLAGDAVLQGIAEVFRAQLRHYDVPARFGGEEFAILLPETAPEQAFEIAERIRRTVAASAFDVETSSEPIRATISIGVAGFPRDGVDSNELIHQADLAVYRAKLQGRNRVLDASSEPLLLPETAAGTPHRGAGGRGPRRPAPAGGRIRADAGTAPSPSARHARTAFPVAVEAARRVRGRGQRRRCDSGCLRRALRHQHRLDWSPGHRRPRRRGAGPRPRGGRRLDLCQRGRRAGRRGAVRPSCGARSRGHDGGGGMERPKRAAPLRALQRRHPFAGVAGCCQRLQRGLQGRRRLDWSTWWPASAQVPVTSPSTWA